MDPLEEARVYLRAADERFNRPLPPHVELADFEKCDREVLQLHIRAMVAAIGAMPTLPTEIVKCKACNGWGARGPTVCEGCHGAGVHRV